MESKTEKNNKIPFLDIVDECRNSEDYPCVDQMKRFDQVPVQVRHPSGPLRPSPCQAKAKLIRSTRNIANTNERQRVE